jgi:hypothetical protein
MANRRLFCLLLILSTGAHAQWLNLPTPGTPRSRDGKPNLTAPAPRQNGGTPDLSGVWQVEGTTDTGGLGESQISPYFLNFLAAFKPGEEPFQSAAVRKSRPDRPPLPPCPPARLPNSDVLPVPFKIVQTPGLTLILYEDFENFRQIHTDGRRLPRDPQPTFLGYSVGSWEGATFVVNTTGFNDLSALDALGHPHSEAMRITERFRRLDFGHMQLQITMDDPATYTRPVTVSVPLRLLPDTDILESVCEDEKDQAHIGHH